VRFLARYLAALPPGKTVLWCYLCWYLATVVRCFDPSPALWLNSLGISAIIGIALRLSVSGPGATRIDGWQTFRLFLMPFCVSSFAALIKGRGYVLVVPPDATGRALAVGAVVVFLAVVGAVKLARRAGR
jgi:hypothetical protein